MKIKYDLKWAQTLDGQLCDDSNTSQWISSKRERIETHKIRSLYDAVLVGANTFVTDLAKLTVRYAEVGEVSKQPIRIILDPNGRVEKELKKNIEQDNFRLLAELKENTLRETILLAPKTSFFESIGLFAKGGLYHLHFERRFENPHFFKDLNFLLQVQNFPISKVLIEGGPKVLTHFLTNNEYDQLIVSISAKLTGGKDHRIFANKVLKNADEYKIKDIRILENDMMLFLNHKDRGFNEVR